MPNQICMVVSLRTEHAGRRFRGRMYLPVNASALTLGTAQWTGTQTAIVANTWAAYFNDWNGSGDNGTISVVSRVGAGEATPVSGVLVDTIPDTQRRRRNKLAAVGISAAVVTS